MQVAPGFSSEGPRGETWESLSYDSPREPEMTELVVPARLACRFVLMTATLAGFFALMQH